MSDAKPTKQQQEQARIDAYLAKGAQPAPVPGDHPTPPPAPAKAAETPTEPPAAPADVPAVPAKAAKPPTARKTAPAKKKAEPAPAPMPWEAVQDYPVAKFSMLYSTVLDAKMVWIGQNMPGGMSKQAMVKQALSEWVEAKIAELRK